MTFNTFKAKELIIEDLGNKKEFEARYKLICATCKNAIEIGDYFFFVGTGKVCTDCIGEMQEVIQ